MKRALTNVLTINDRNDCNPRDNVSIVSKQNKIKCIEREYLKEREVDFEIAPCEFFSVDGAQSKLISHNPSVLQGDVIMTYNDIQ